MDEKRSLVWGLVHGKPQCCIMYGDARGSGGKDLIELQYPHHLKTYELPADAPSDLNDLIKQYPCPEIKEESS